MNLSVIIPAYNEEANIMYTIDGLLKAISSIENIQIIVVDDHSTDDTFEIINQLNDTRISCLRLSRQCGSHTAFRAGLIEAVGDVALLFSADGQDDPNCVDVMLEKWRDGSKIVWALRKSRKNETIAYRNIAELFYRCLRWLGGFKNSLTDMPRADFFLLDRIAINALNKCKERNTSLLGLIDWLGFEQASVEYERKSRRFGTSKWNFRSRFRLARDWIVAFSNIPLRLSTIVGTFIAFLGFLFAVHLIYNAFFGNPIQGYSSILVVILVLGGIQMIMIGVIGEYLSRSLDESRRRPIFFIEKKTSKKDQTLH